MVASHSQNRSLERIGRILDFIEGQYKSNPTKETFQFAVGKLSSFDPLLEDMDLLKMAFKKIATDTKENIKIEFRQGLPEQNTAVNLVTHELLLWLYVEDQNKFKEYQNSVKKEVEKVGQRIQFVLDSEGMFYPEGASQETKHSLKKDSDRFDLLYFLAKEKQYVATKVISDKLDMPVPRVRKAVNEVRNILVRKWALPRGALFESDNVSGYRVTNVTLG